MRSVFCWENNQKLGKTWVWTYDVAGNITSRKEYAYTEGNLGTVVSTMSYNYGDSDWGDLLTGCAGWTFSYDEIGNVTQAGTFTYTWEHGRQLANMRCLGLHPQYHRNHGRNAG